MLSTKVRLITVWVMASLLASCANIYKAKNPTITDYQFANTYRADYHSSVREVGDNLVILAFSGGGTRASALSYGVMQELRDTLYLSSNGHKQALLDDVDFISAVSGGSFTAAYYAVFGDELFTRFEEDFLRQSVEDALWSRLLSPRHWFRSIWSGIDRTEMAIEYYDTQVFRGAKFSDIPIGERPFVLINATDLSRGVRFPFDQDSFDWICGDLSRMSIARAVTASSAVPVAFPTVVLKNNASECDLSGSPLKSRFEHLDHGSVKKRAYINNVRALRNPDEKPFIHLVDGGISDNLGLRAVSDQLEVFGADSRREFDRELKRVVVILVNSAVAPRRMMDSSPTNPSIFETIDAVSSGLIDSYAEDTKGYFFDQASEFKLQITEQRPDIEFHIIEVSFQAITEDGQRKFFNNLPTTLALKEAQVDAVIAAGRSLLRSAPEFQRLKSSLDAEIKYSTSGSNFELQRKLKFAPYSGEE